jgi:hypothetical protein
MKLYLAGPMRNIPKLNFPAFDSAAAYLRTLGHEVFNPADNDRKLEAEGKPVNLRVCLGDDLSWICKHADGLALLPGWEHSSGATAEKRTADSLGLNIIYLHKFQMAVGNRDVGDWYTLNGPDPIVPVSAPLPTDDVSEHEMYRGADDLRKVDQAKDGRTAYEAWARTHHTQDAVPQMKCLPNLIEDMSSEERKKYPVKTGFLDYFRDAVFRVARVSYEGNQKHNPGEATHWARGKSDDHEDCLARHFLANADEEHKANTAWRAMADLQLFLEKKYDIKPPPGAWEGTNKG